MFSGRQIQMPSCGKPCVSCSLAPDVRNMFDRLRSILRNKGLMLYSSGSHQLLYFGNFQVCHKKWNQQYVVNTSGKQIVLAPRGAVFTSARVGRQPTASHKEQRHCDSECIAQAAGVIAGEPWKMYAAAPRLICQTAKLNAARTTAASDRWGHGGSSIPRARKPNGIEWFLHLEPPSEGWTRAKSAHIMSPVHQGCTDPGRGAHTY